MKTTLLIPVIHLFFVIILEAQLPSPIIIDHTSVGKFSEISEEKIQKEIPIRVMFRHASVGTTINNGLDCISGSRKSPKECTVFPIGKYDRSNWSFQPRGNSGWYGKVDDFVAEVDKQADNFDVFSFKYCYLEGLDGILEPCGSTFDPAKVQKAWDYLRDGYETLESKYTDKVFIWWTIPLTQVGMKCTDSLNSRIREYCRNNNKILFDIADIESYDTLGNHQIG
ncbi:MAG: hypothetical protein QG635_237, partial [Bacteroidota bacterium]|nr:hypothetical protein [Bacteroidota bacterium]